ncbi:3-phenylpropionate/trans-cinnamate dioxygenase ferredoxin reductase subunit [Pseudooceanicola antarcticus]|uniref:3-phenylpropionate/trans-cinnamate dioxygenase ferredoxin reductase subunit n=1 Tax=Pseudooceanicola antarcticus TaxID=1247613 RepID=A0A285HJD0_9RHOB|nr:FAD-dependent oxidoreductase [Pseudooceanicola antarcticus]PJE27947.1 pyridine nucleotide-disulfide oxidoreductase [Pseudooceanicola antarcticus]SNY35723.1 3-phenylpropionate/trans-cinnamate dioxygenase ferredoxin reductase subunit [Pseudooceanicola antarcticus]
MPHIAVIGAGQAGASLVARLRTKGFDGEITLIGAEPVPPYQRPPLSKKFLLGEMAEERLYLRPAAWYAENGITLRMGDAVEALMPAAREIVLGGEVLHYDQLALTTGALPRHLPAAIGGDLGNVFGVRNLADIEIMAPHVRPGARALIIGGGYIGLEAAAVAASKGVQVTLIEMAPRILQRVAAAETSDYFRALHQANGVTILESTGLERLLGDRDVTGAVLSDGTHLDVDFVVVGTGILPDEGLAEDAGLRIENGIACDAQCRTSDAAIWAAGDCASFPWRGGRLRLESVQNAIDMAECAADNMLGLERDYDPKPWFWSDQYDVKLQIAGLNTGYDRLVTRRDDKGARSHWYFAGDQLLAVDAMNDPRGYMVGKRLIDAGRTADPARIADPSVDLKELMKG